MDTHENRKNGGPREAPVPPPRQNSPVWLAVHVLFTDLLGAFIPGVFFTAVLVVSCGLFMVMLGDKILWVSVVTNAESIKIFDSLSSCILFIFCIFSYIIGSIFYRKDIKEPDRASAAYVYNQIADEKEREFFAFGPKDSPANEPKKRLWVRIFQKIRNWRRRGPAKVSPNDLEVDFPYLYLKRYLEKWDLHHLADYIRWDGTDQGNQQRRSKMFINILKLRIHKLAPLEMQEIIKNEAHARLMNSLWYTAKSIRFIAILSLNASALIGLLSVTVKTDFVFKLSYLFFFLILFFIANYIRRSIKQYFHYLRVREIVSVLETAYDADHYKNPDFSIFSFVEQDYQDKEQQKGDPA